MAINEVEQQDLAGHLEDAIGELDVDAMGIAHNLGSATTKQLHEIVEFAERLKRGALIEMWGREREHLGLDHTHLEEPPEGYQGWHAPDVEQDYSEERQ